MHQWVLAQLFYIFFTYCLNRLCLPDSRMQTAFVLQHRSKQIVLKRSRWYVWSNRRFFSFSVVSLPVLLGIVITQTIAFQQQSFLLDLQMKLFFITRIFSRIVLIKDKVLWANDEFVWWVTCLCWMSLLPKLGFTAGPRDFNYVCKVCPCSIRMFYSFYTWALTFQCHFRAPFVLVRNQVS